MLTIITFVTLIIGSEIVGKKFKINLFSKR